MVLAAAAGFLPVARAHAQTGTTVLIGRVSDAATGEALEGAQVIVPELGKGGRTDGRGDTTGIVFRLERMPIAINPVEVKAPAVSRLRVGSRGGGSGSAHSGGAPTGIPGSGGPGAAGQDPPSRRSVR